MHETPPLTQPVEANYYVQPVRGKVPRGARAGTIQPQLANLEVSVPKQFANAPAHQGLLVPSGFPTVQLVLSHAFHHAEPVILRQGMLSPTPGWPSLGQASWHDASIGDDSC